MRNLLIISLLIFTVACGPGRKQAWDKAVDNTPKGGLSAEKQAEFDKLNTDAKTAWENRDDKKSLQTALNNWEKSYAIQKDSTVAAWLARGSYLMADGHVYFNTIETDDSDDEVVEKAKEEFLEVLKKGMESAEEALFFLNPNMQKRLKNKEKLLKILQDWTTRLQKELGPLGEKIKAEKMPGKIIKENQAKITEIIKKNGFIGKEGVPLMYWYATNLGVWAKTKGFTTLLFYKDRIKAIMDYLLLVDQDYYSGGPLRYLGIFYAKAPSFAGGDVKVSKLFFEYADSTNPALSTKRCMAEYLIPRLQEMDDDAREEYFTKTLNAVINHKQEGDAAKPRPEDSVEKRKAKILLEQADDLL